MKKRGASHADWAISMGMFIVYILTMFIIIQPGAQKVFREENLINIVENGIINATEYSIEITPLYFNFTEELIPGGGPDYDIIMDDVDVPFEPNSGNDNFRMFDADGNELPLSISVSEGGKAVTLRFTYIFPSTDPDTLYRFNFYYSAEGEYTEGLPFINNPPTRDVQSNEYTFRFGSTEKIKGLRKGGVVGEPPGVVDLCDIGYDNVKANWGYPLNKEFRIYFVDQKEGEDFVPLTYTYPDDATSVCEEVEPYEQANVFVKELVTTFMNMTGGKEQARINIRVW